MAIFFSFVPWFIFWIFLSLRMIEIAALGGFVFALLIIIFDVWKKYSIKILQLGTLIFFFIIAILAFVVNLDWLGRWVNPIGTIALALIMFISIIIKKPFTLQYAKETTPIVKWKSPQFIRVNYIISWVWFIMLFINSFFSVLFTTILPVKIWVNWTISLSCFGVAIAFTQIYRNHIKKKR